ncbi:ODF3A protein, partial [Podargus strigoides]|nr:ODF3A protein [Podargus strigoides]
GDYSPEKANRHVYKCLPVQSMSFWHRAVKTNATPGPSTYTLPRVTGPSTACPAVSPCCSMRWKSQCRCFDADLAKVNSRPAVFTKTQLDAYKTRAPGYSMGTRTNLAGDKTVKPGLSEYCAGRVR